ncbi:hypothetical protein FNW02_36225 [Komarekiella sp. 'clone 1']|uniref:Uncharacterized protein n=1 Tax=Komarekiella delphini-convector SJRDD-AB1 TaxID=2593771 RepID=A0AA40VVG4_9NOST|nr:hypothetical protein [Komarekiella delphini-convector]MBD6621028.1 hypothetical protein [Komarekiella delphini-convector SJRDD-AB1]
MCRIIRQSVRKIRKPHHCWGCAQKFPPGTQMEYSFGILDGDVNDSYCCLDCSRFIDAIYKHTKLYSDCCEGLEFGEVRSLKADPHYYKIPEIVFTEAGLPYPSVDNTDEDSAA